MRTRSCQPPRWRREPSFFDDRCCGRSSGRSSCPNLLANFHLFRNAEQLIQMDAFPRDVVDVERAVDLAAVAAGAGDAADPPQAQVPPKSWLGHVQGGG